MIIDDLTDVEKLKDAHCSGYVPRDYELDPIGLDGVAAPFSLTLIPQAEWPDRIADMTRTKTRLGDLLKSEGIKPYNQGYTNYCWAHAPVFCVEASRVVQGQKHVRLSPASVAAPATNYRNWRGSPAGIGGWNGQALKRIVSHGVNSEPYWTPNSADPANDTEEAKEERKLYSVTEWFDGQARNFDQLMTCLLLRIPCATAHMWMQHAVTAIDPVYIKGQFGFVAWNSGYLRDANGFTTILGQRAVPDEWVAPRVALAT